MYLIQKALLLFTLNLLDGLLTIFWVRNGVAPESNQLMASLLDIGNFPFLAVKIAMGGVTAFVLLYWGDRRLARYGMTLVLALYFGIIGVHIFTGLAAFGIATGTVLPDIGAITGRIAELFA
jgi:hypothetical protein